MRRSIRPKFSMDIAHTHNAGPLPRGAQRSKLLGISSQGHGREDQRSGWFSRTVAALAVWLVVLVVLTGLIFVLAGQPRLIRHPPVEIGLWAVGIVLLIFVIWLLVFVCRMADEAKRVRRRRKSLRERRAAENPLNRS